MADAEEIKTKDELELESKNESTQLKEKIAFLEAESKKAYDKQDKVVRHDVFLCRMAGFGRRGRL